VNDLQKSIIYFDNSFFYSNLNNFIWNFDVIVGIIDTGSFFTFFTFFYKHYVFDLFFISLFFIFYFAFIFFFFIIYFLIAFHFFSILKKKYNVNFSFISSYFYNPYSNRWEEKENGNKKKIVKQKS
jgi:Na+/H+-dicarboxylate symporter